MPRHHGHRKHKERREDSRSPRELFRDTPKRATTTRTIFEAEESEDGQSYHTASQTDPRDWERHERNTVAVSPTSGREQKLYYPSEAQYAPHGNYRDASAQTYRRARVADSISEEGKPAKHRMYESNRRRGNYSTYEAQMGGHDLANKYHKGPRSASPEFLKRAEKAVPKAIAYHGARAEMQRRRHSISDNGTERTDDRGTESTYASSEAFYDDNRYSRVRTISTASDTESAATSRGCSVSTAPRYHPTSDRHRRRSPSYD